MRQTLCQNYCCGAKMLTLSELPLLVGILPQPRGNGPTFEDIFECCVF